MRIELPEKVKFIIETIENAGFEAYAVGGCVRDSMMNREPNDWDITTSAKPHEVKALFPRTIDTGIQHGTVTVMMKKDGFEVTTYRIDGEYEDSRHPKEVTFTPDLSEDLRRRDFTINAMAYNDRTGLVDLFGGKEDLERKVIRAVGVPEERFTEDALRIMRAFRFAAQLDFSIEESTCEAAERLAGTLKNISAERIRDELTKLVVSDHPEYLLKLYKAGITAIVFPELDKCIETEQNNVHHMYNVGEHIVHSMMELKKDEAGKFLSRLGYQMDSDTFRVLRLSLMLHDIGKPECHTVGEDGVDHFYRHADTGEHIAEDILRRLKEDNHTIDLVRHLVRFHDARPEPKARSVRRAASKIGSDTFPLYLLVQYCDIMAQSDYEKQEKIDRLNKVADIYMEIKAKGECLSIKELAVNGGDLIKEAGMKPGPDMGRVLNELLEEVIKDPVLNEKQKLISIAKDLIHNA